MQPKRILIIQLRQLGDILLTTPCLAAIKADHPDHVVGFLCHVMAKPLLIDHPSIDYLHTYKDETFFRSPSAFLSLLKDIKGKKYSIVIDFMNNPRSALLTFLIRAPQTLSWTSRRFFFYHTTLTRPDSSLYIVEQKFNLLRHLGIACTESKFHFFWSHNDQVTTDTFLKTLAIEFHKPTLHILMSATHRRIKRRWPLELYARLSDYLYTHHKASITWLWGPGELEVAKKAQRLCKHSTHLAPKTSLPELCYLISRFDLFIGNSNGPSHIAVGLDVPSFQIHGPTDPQSWSPNTTRHQAIQAPAPDYNLFNLTLEDVLPPLNELITSLFPLSSSSKPLLSSETVGFENELDRPLPPQSPLV